MAKMQRLNVLVVGDDKTLRGTVAFEIQLLEHNVIEAANSLNALFGPSDGCQR